MDLIEKVNNKLSQAKRIEERLEFEVKELIASANKNLETLKGRLNVSQLKEEVRAEINKIRSLVINDLRERVNSCSDQELDYANARACTWEKDLNIVSPKGKLVRSLRGGSEFEDDIACLIICLSDIGVISFNHYKENCLEELNNNSLHLIASTLKINSVHEQFIDVLSCLSDLNYYEVKPVQRRSVKLITLPL